MGDDNVQLFLDKFRLKRYNNSTVSHTWKYMGYLNESVQQRNQRTVTYTDFASVLVQSLSKAYAGKIYR